MKRVCILSSVHIALDNRVFYREALSLRRAGYDVILIAVHDRDEVREGVKIRALPRVPRWQRPLLWRTLFRMARETEADIYHFHDPELLLVTPWLRRQTGKPTIYDVHEVYADFIKVKDYMPVWMRYPIAWVFRWLEPLLARFQSGLIFSDAEIARSFAAVDLPKEVLFNFPALSLVEKGERAVAQRGEREPVVLYLGGMERNRGTGLMIEAFRTVLEKEPQARLLLVGHFMPPELEDEVREAARRLGIADAVRVTGRVPFSSIGDYLQRARVGWVSWQPVPKNEKNIPTKLFEYMSYGLPIVSSDLASTRPFVSDGENGYLVQADDPDSHAAAIVRLLRHPEEADAMGLAGQRLVREKYNWAVMEERLLDFYQKLLS